MTLAMALGVVPMTAFAEETSQAAKQAAAEQALESRVFEIGEEQLTLADLEQSDFIAVSDENGEIVTLAGDEVRDYLLLNPQASVQCAITTSVEYVSEQNGARMRVYATASQNISSITATNIECVTTTYVRYASFDELSTTFSIGTKSGFLYSPVFSYPIGFINSGRVYYDEIRVSFKSNATEAVFHDASPIP